MFDLEERRKRKRESFQKVYQAKTEFLQKWRVDQGCLQCGETDPVVLDCDHIDPETKSQRLRVRGRSRSLQLLSWPELYAELEKCQVLCANCHRRKTYQDYLATASP